MQCHRCRCRCHRHGFTNTTVGLVIGYEFLSLGVNHKSSTKRFWDISISSHHIILSSWITTTLFFILPCSPSLLCPAHKFAGLSLAFRISCFFVLFCIANVHMTSIIVCSKHTHTYNCCRYSTMTDKCKCLFCAKHQTPSVVFFVFMFFVISVVALDLHYSSTLLCTVHFISL